MGLRPTLDLGTPGGLARASPLDSARPTVPPGIPAGWAAGADWDNWGKGAGEEADCSPRASICTFPSPSVLQTSLKALPWQKPREMARFPDSVGRKESP